MPKNKLNKQVEDFFDAVLMLKNHEECEKFFLDVCTERELNSISQRLEVAKLLKIRKTYNEIELEIGASTATISRVNRSLQAGADGYELVLDELIQRDLQRAREQKKKESK